MAKMIWYGVVWGHLELLRHIFCRGVTTRPYHSFRLLELHMEQVLGIFIALGLASEARLTQIKSTRGLAPISYVNGHSN